MKNAGSGMTTLQERVGNVRTQDDRRRLGTAVANDHTESAIGLTTAKTPIKIRREMAQEQKLGHVSRYW